MLRIRITLDWILRLLRLKSGERRGKRENQKKIKSERDKNKLENMLEPREKKIKKKKIV